MEEKEEEEEGKGEEGEPPAGLMATCRQEAHLPAGSLGAAPTNQRRGRSAGSGHRRRRCQFSFFFLSFFFFFVCVFFFVPREKGTTRFNLISFKSNHHVVLVELLSKMKKREALLLPISLVTFLLKQSI